MSNRLARESSPYLLQHAENPVDWYPWGEEAFRKAEAEDKPLFVSVGYSTCHWCHVMARESFEDPAVAALLNRDFVPVKVDREERPDVDSVTMAVCQAFTGSGGWPTSVFMAPDQRPLFAGTYFPPTSRGGVMGFRELLETLSQLWRERREDLLRQSQAVQARLKGPETREGLASPELVSSAVALYKRAFDPENGGFGRAPKFPAAHNLLFLMEAARHTGDRACLAMAERTLERMARGGICDQIGGGFCRYSTDERWLVPHFEKMLYDNALLILAYCRAWELTERGFYLETAERTARYLLREMAAPGGGFYSAQDADSGGEEGGYYLFTPEEIVGQLGEETGRAFCRRYGITEQENFRGKSVPHLLDAPGIDGGFDECLPKLREYRKRRCELRTDDKILTAWNGLTIAALCALYRATGKDRYLDEARRADEFIQRELCQDDQLFVSFREGRRGVRGFLDDYAAYLFAQLWLYRVRPEKVWLDRAVRLADRVLSAFQDEAGGGFFLTPEGGERLFLRPKETGDGALPSGNSLMAWNLVRLSLLTGEARLEKAARRQLDFLSGQAGEYPAGYAVFLLALLEDLDPPSKVTVALAPGNEAPELPRDCLAVVLRAPTEEYPLKEGRTTYYVCRGGACLPPTNDRAEALNALR